MILFSFLKLLFNLSFDLCNSISVYISPQGQRFATIFAQENLVWKFLVSQTKNLFIYLLTENCGNFGPMINSHSLKFNSNKTCSTHVNLVCITYWKLYLTLSSCQSITNGDWKVSCEGIVPVVYVWETVQDKNKKQSTCQNTCLIVD